MPAMIARRSFTPTSTPVPGALALGAFLPEALVSTWVRAGQASRAGARLALADGRQFVLEAAMRVLGRRDGELDPYGMTGRADSVSDLLARGAIVAQSGLRLGAAVYDVEPGFLVEPVPGADDSGAHPKAG